jgi:aspartate carbamoyltransferase catalytic subunit
LSLLLRNFQNISISFVAPDGLNIPTEYIRDGDLLIDTLTDELLMTSDVIYMTRVQKERFGDIASYEAVKDAFIFDTDTVQKMHDKAILMHPLPRVNEISLEIDSLPQARYFAQAANGVPVRMALIRYCLEG